MKSIKTWDELIEDSWTIDEHANLAYKGDRFNPTVKLDILSPAEHVILGQLAVQMHDYNLSKARVHYLTSVLLKIGVAFEDLEIRVDGPLLQAYNAGKVK